jgi:hypothetical protein
MKITNKHNVPETLVALASTEYYSKGKADYSVTEIISPPRIQRLRKKHYAEMEQDVADMLWQLLGSALHVVAERGQHEGYITEERLYAEIDGVTLSGAIDIQKKTPEGVLITDYKFTSAWALRQDKPEWEAQQNIYAWLVSRAKREKVIGVQICALIRDWSRREASVKPEYPQAPIQVIDLPLWEESYTERYIRERLNDHRESKVASDWEEELPECTPDDRWVRGDAWAVMREGKKRATKVCETEEEAKEFVSNMPEKDKPYIEKRSGEAIRCANNFCGVNQWCSQYQNQLKQGEES